MLRHDLLDFCEELIEQLTGGLQPPCERAEIAGSIRRKKPEVKDIEVLVIPRARSFTTVDLFGDPMPAADQWTELDDWLDRMVEIRNCLEWQLNEHGNRAGDGPRYKKLFAPALNAKIDLFIVNVDNWGSQLAIRTGCWEFSKWFMTSRRNGGGMPVRMAHRDGYLWECGSDADCKPVAVPCATERDFFKAISVKWYEPEERTPELAARLWRRS